MNARTHTKEKKQGITLLEIVIYVAIFGIIAVIISNFLIQVVRAYNIARAEREVISNGRLLLETVTKSIAEAQEIYSPTSVFANDTGQLALATKSGVEPEHQTTYVDFWIDNGRLWMKKEGSSAIPLSGVSVRVSKFRLDRISQGLGRDAVKITMRVDYWNQSYSSTITINTTTALRGSY